MKQKKDKFTLGSSRANSMLCSKFLCKHHFVLNSLKKKQLATGAMTEVWA
jgi:hypothetical protein